MTSQVSLYYEVPELAPPDVNHDLLKDYVAYARANVHPVISEEVRQENKPGSLVMFRARNSRDRPKADRQWQHAQVRP